MKIAIECRSPLLQKSLENFLEGHLCSSRNCDLLLSDEKLVGRDNVLRIGSDAEADILKPFSKSQLLLKLEHFYKIREEAHTAMDIVNQMDDNTFEGVELAFKEKPLENVSELEAKIERLTASYVQGVMSLVREHRGE